MLAQLLIDVINLPCKFQRLLQIPKLLQENCANYELHDDKIGLLIT